MFEICVNLALKFESIYFWSHSRQFSKVVSVDINIRERKDSVLAMFKSTCQVNKEGHIQTDVSIGCVGVWVKKIGHTFKMWLVEMTYPISWLFRTLSGFCKYVPVINIFAILRRINTALSEPSVWLVQAEHLPI